MKPHRGVLILVFGILSLVICALFGPAAWIMGNADLNEMAAGTMDPEGKGMTQAGRICGMIASILMILGVIIGIAVFALGLLGAASGAGN